MIAASSNEPLADMEAERGLQQVLLTYPSCFDLLPKSFRPQYAYFPEYRTSLAETFAIRRAIEKLEAKLLEGHLHGCVVEGIQDGETDRVVGELLELYALANR